MIIRPVDPASSAEILLVARRWQQTLDEVVGQDRTGESSKSEQWVEEHVRKHLDPSRLTGQVYLAQTPDAGIVGHTVLRLDEDEAGNTIGLFATIFVQPDQRRGGIASALVERGERWMLEHSMTRAVTYTDKNNTRLHRLFAKHGYTLTPMPRDFVALSKELAP